MNLLEYKNPYWKNNPQFFLQLVQLVKDFPNNGGYVHILNKFNRHKDRKKLNSDLKHMMLCTWVMDVTHQYDNEIFDMATRIYWILNGLVEAPRCMNENCKKKILHRKFDPTKQSQPQYCSHHCLNTSSLHTAHANAKKFENAKIDKDYWKKRELKSKATKVKNGYDPNWNNSRKTLKTVQQHVNDNPDYFKEIEQKRKQTKIKNGHSPNWHNEQQMVATRYKKNNGKWESKSTAQQRRKQSLEKYGFASPNSSPIVKQHKKEGCLKKFGVDSYSKTEMYHKQMILANDERKAKEYATKKKNGTFNISKPEIRVYEFLCKHYGKDDVEHQYKSDVYPFNCDFYIKSLDLYIECNFSWTHGGHWFDSSNKEDLDKVQKWRDKGTKFYLNAVQTWTVRDVKKKEYAKKNKLKYVVLWTEDYSVLMSNVTQFESK